MIESRIVTPAEAYEQFLVPAIFAPWAHVVMRAHPPAPGSRVLDVACGTGIGARLAAAIVGRTGLVAGLDSDHGMLSVARAIRRSTGDAGTEWYLASALEMPFPDHEFDYVLCLEGLQFFADRSAGLREIRRVLRPGGRLVGSVWGSLEQNPGYHAIAEGLRRFVSVDAARLPAFTLHDADTIRALGSGAGFLEVSVTLETLTFAVPSVREFVDWVAAGAPTTRHNLALLTDDRREAFHRFVDGRLATHRTADGVLLPSARNIVVAR